MTTITALFSLIAKFTAGAALGLLMALGFTSGTTLSFEDTSPLPTVFATSSTAVLNQISTSSTSTPSSSKSKPAQKIPEKQATSPTPVPDNTAPARPAAPAMDPTQLNSITRASVVNILCTTGGGGYFQPISGSGVIIGSQGVILTNAHVAQYFLLKDYPTKDNVTCTVRMGSPAKALYTAELLYLPPAWMAANASQISSSHATGTGENDYAFLLITGTTDPSASLPSSFPFLPMTTATPEVDDSMLLASYPAGFLSGINIETSLYLTSAYSTVKQLFVFQDADTWVDLFSIPGTVVSQGGSSGGAAVRVQDGSLAGIIVTATVATTTSQRDLRAVSIAHIQHSLEAAGIPGGIPTLLSGNVEATAHDFMQNIAPTLKQELIDALR